MNEEKTLSLKEFTEAFGSDNAVQTAPDYTWTNFQSRNMVVRYPLACTTPPTPQEINTVFAKLNPVILTYAEEVSDKNPENTFLYISYDQEYVLDKLKGPQRRTTKKALRSFEFREISWKEFEEKGAKCYKDARDRNSLSDGDLGNFLKMVRTQCTIPSYKILAAIDPESGRLAAALVFNHIDNIVTTTGHYSDNDFLINRPNNGLFHILKENYIVSKKVKVIEYGYSSIQKSSNFESLHFFKVSIGFDAKPICRKFVINPKYKMWFNPLTKLACSAALLIAPRNKRLVKLKSLFELIG